MHHPTDRIAHAIAFITPVVEHCLEQEIAQWVIMRDRSNMPWCIRSLDRSHIVDLLSYFSFQPVLHDWCKKNKRLSCAILYGIVHIKDPLLLIGKSSPCCGGSRFPLSLSEWSFTIIMSDAI